MLAEYGRDYFIARQDDAERRQIAYRQEYERVIQHINSGYLLDVGCGTGEFAAQFIGDSWQRRWALEPDNYARKEAIKRGIFVANSWHDVPEQAFDLVVYRGVLQHIDEPFNSLRQARRVLKTGGTLAILAQPNADSISYRLFGTLPALDPPRNWWIPGARELRNILVNLGFDHIEISYPYWSGPYAQPLKDFGRFILAVFGRYRPFAWPGNMLEVYARRGI